MALDSTSSSTIVQARGHATYNSGSDLHSIKTSRAADHLILCNIGINVSPIYSSILVRKNGEGSRKRISKDSFSAFNDQDVSDSKMSVEKLDDVMAALTLTATAVMIALGFLFNL